MYLKFQCMFVTIAKKILCYVVYHLFLMHKYFVFYEKFVWILLERFAIITIYKLYIIYIEYKLLHMLRFHNIGVADSAGMGYALCFESFHGILNMEFMVKTQHTGNGGYFFLIMDAEFLYWIFLYVHVITTLVITHFLHSYHLSATSLFFREKPFYSESCLLYLGGLWHINEFGNILNGA
ncbi:hypothetical protein ACJX0J_020049 [Zea mays]